MRFKIFRLTFVRCLCFLVLLSDLSIYGAENDSDGYFFPSFRSGHNLSLFLSAEYTTWRANQSLVPSNPGDTDDQIRSVTINSAQESKPVLALFFRYAYHINIISSFGFFVGSTIGLFSSNGSYGKQKNFYPGYGIAFPTVLGGLVQGIGQDFRLMTGIEYGAVWFPQMKIFTQSNEEKGLSPAPDMFGIFVGVDNFLTRNTALSFNVGYRQVTNPCLNNCSSSIYLNSLSLTSKSYYTQLGVTWLVGEFTVTP